MRTSIVLAERCGLRLKAIPRGCSAPRPAVAAAAVARLVAHDTTHSQRTFSSQPVRSATYRRFGQSGAGAGYNPSSAAVSGLLSRLTGRSSGGGKRGRGIPPIIYLVIGGGGIYYVLNLEQVPQTGRWRFNDVSIAQEQAIGAETYQQTLQEFRGKILPPNHPYAKQVKRVAEKLVQAIDETGMHSPGKSNVSGAEGVRHASSHTQEVASSASSRRSGTGSHLAVTKADGSTDWEVFVIKADEEKNAFVLPGGKIFVFTGILPVCKSDDGLATVLGHEIAHQLARHSAEKMAGTKILLFGATLLQLFGLDFGLSQAAATLLLQLPNSRKTEEEADQIGLQLMAKACYDPSQAVGLWERMQASEGSEGGALAGLIGGILSTHPVTGRRIQKIKGWLPEATKARDDAGCQIAGGYSLGQAMHGFGGAQQQRISPPSTSAGGVRSEDPYGLASMRR